MQISPHQQSIMDSNTVARSPNKYLRQPIKRGGSNPRHISSSVRASRLLQLRPNASLIQLWQNRYPTMTLSEQIPRPWQLRPRDSFKYCNQASFQYNSPKTEKGMLAQGTILSQFFFKLHAKQNKNEKHRLYSSSVHSTD